MKCKWTVYPTTTHSHKQWIVLMSKLLFWTLTVSEYCSTSLSVHWGNIETERSPKCGYAFLLFRMTTRVLYSTRCHRQHCTLHSFEQFGALYMHNNDNKYPAQTGFEPGTCRLQAPVDTNEPSGPAWTIRAARGTDKKVKTLWIFFQHETYMANWIFTKWKLAKFRNISIFAISSIFFYFAPLLLFRNGFSACKHGLKKRV